MNVIKMICARFKVTEKDAQYIYDEVSNSLKNIIIEKNLQLNVDHELCKESFHYAVKSIIFNQLDIYAQPAHFYIQAKSLKAVTYEGNKAVDKWIKVLGFSESPYGSLKIAIDNGSVDFAAPPEVVYENDEYSSSTVNGLKVINHTRAKGNRGRIIGGFVTLSVKGHLMSYELNMDDIKRLAAYKAKLNKSDDLSKTFYADIDDGKIDEGFLKAKVLKHALKVLKVKGSRFRDEKFEADEDDQPKYETKIDNHLNF